MLISEFIKIYQDLSKKHSAIEPPIWAGLLANSVKKSNFSTAILDAEASNVGSTDIQVVADFTGATGDATTGNATVTVKYLQNNQIAIAGDVPA